MHTTRSKTSSDLGCLLVLMRDIKGGNCVVCPCKQNHECVNLAKDKNLKHIYHMTAKCELEYGIVTIYGTCVPIGNVSHSGFNFSELNSLTLLTAKMSKHKIWFSLRYLFFLPTIKLLMGFLQYDKHLEMETFPSERNA